MAPWLGDQGSAGHRGLPGSATYYLCHVEHCQPFWVYLFVLQTEQSIAGLWPARLRTSHLITMYMCVWGPFFAQIEALHGSITEQ
jgi:hypothetical protein